MTEEIRHTTKALKLLQHAKSAETPRKARLLIADAQVHATLALVEQQRIANRIALASAVAEASRMAGTQGSVLGLIVEEVGLFDYPDTEHGTPPLHKDIREGLGL